MNKEKLKQMKCSLLLDMIIEEENKSKGSSLPDKYLLHVSLLVFFSTIISLLAFINSPYGILNGLIVVLFYVFVMLSTVFMLSENLKYSIELKSKLLSIEHLSLPFKKQHPAFTDYFSGIMKSIIFDNNQLTNIIKKIKCYVSESEFKSAIYNKDVIKIKNEYGVGSLFYICYLIDNLCYNDKEDIVESEKQDIQNKYMMDKFKDLNHYSSRIKLNEENEINSELIEEISKLQLENIDVSIELISGKVVLMCSFEARIYEEGLSNLLERLGKSERFFNKMSVI